ncbi:hypothetical protein [Armatimonas rosea]|uniref:Uncharacterized protein n=1 Tax=Armatimonas rosea TaxID=685828 RepID=A0A7W9W722_ARMRO|nr:hypothetical protein [Armatimonas rosea]MBB6050147.1 hypothetical protein [Armatimonas rosea]
MLLITPPTLTVLTQTDARPQAARPRVAPIKVELTHLIPTVLVELLSTPELAPLFFEDESLKARVSAGKVPLAARPVGLDNLIASDADHTLIAQGTPEALKELRAFLKSLDVEPQGVLLTMRQVQKGKPESHPVVQTFSNLKASITVGGAADIQSLTVPPPLSCDVQSVTVIPHLNRDGKTVVVAAKVNKEKWLVQTGKLGGELKFVFPHNQELSLTATRQ